MKETDVSNAIAGKWLSFEKLKSYLCCGRPTAEKIGKESGALVRIGRRVLYDREKIDAYLNQLAEKGGE